MMTADLYRLASISTWVAMIALVLSGIALALFFGGAGAFWGPINDGFIVVTAIGLIPAVLAVDRLASGDGSLWVRLLTVAAIAGLVVMAAGQTLLIVGRLSLEGSYVTGGIGVVPFIAWIVLVAVLGLGGGASLPQSVGVLAVVSLAAIVAMSVIAALTRGPLLWVSAVALVVAISAWLVALAQTFSERALTAPA